MRALAMASCLSLFALTAVGGLPALAQEGRYVDPAPVNFDAPFQFDGLRVKDPLGRGLDGPAAPRAEGVPIEVWLRNGRTLKGLGDQQPPPSYDLDADTLRGLFKDLLPVEGPKDKAPSPTR